MKIMKLSALATIPCYKTALAAGADLTAVQMTTINPGERKLVCTGISIELPEGWEAQIRPRSGLALKHGITVLNAPGTIDADYRGEIKVLLINHSNEPFKIVAGDRIAQMVIAEHRQPHFEEVEWLAETERGYGGFGSTGK